METVLKFERVVLTKELNDKFKKVGEVFEVASILENSFLLRDTSTKVALGVVSFKDFDECFKVEERFKGWTPWTEFIADNGIVAFYRTNLKKVQVKIGNVKSESSCHKVNDFNLYFGIMLAYIRCRNKMLSKRREEILKEDIVKELKSIEVEITDNNKHMKRMIGSLVDKVEE